MKSILIVIVAVAVCFSAYAASDVRNGVWTAELQGDKLDMTIFHGKEGRKSIMGFDEPLGTFTGLSKTDLTSSAANVQFELRRPAGTFAFEGRVANGTGVGHYRFTPSEAFIREMDSLRYRDFKDEQLLVFAMNDFSPQTIRDLRAMGYEPTKREVEEIAIFRITPEYIRELSEKGYNNVPVEKLLKLRIMKADQILFK